MKTLIPGPFDLVDRDDLIKVQGGIPETLYTELFHRLLPRRGAQDRIIATLIDIFHQEITNLGAQYNDDKNEQIAIKALNNIGRRIGYDYSRSL